MWLCMRFFVFINFHLLCLLPVGIYSHVFGFRAVVTSGYRFKWHDALAIVLTGVRYSILFSVSWGLVARTRANCKSMTHTQTLTRLFFFCLFAQTKTTFINRVQSFFVVLYVFILNYSDMLFKCFGCNCTSETFKIETKK